MNTLTFVIALGAIASTRAGVITPASPLVSAYNTILPQPLVTPLVIVPEGHSLEGQYIPDNLEKLYDDGSYKPEITTASLTTSPDEFETTGPGLDGEYVPDNLEKLYDDGSYKPEVELVESLPLSLSPYGLVPSGSGLEGQYVPDVSERLLNDGSYVPESVVNVAH